MPEPTIPTNAAALPSGQPVVPAEKMTAAVLAEPSAGGSYLRDPVTGALTLVTPSTVQE